jgi:hypothetical protein
LIGSASKNGFFVTGGASVGGAADAVALVVGTAAVRPVAFEGEQAVAIERLSPNTILRISPL